MKQVLLFATLVIWSTGYANNTTPQQTLLQKLNYVNAEWAKQPEQYKATSTQQITGNYTYSDWIATHLMLVEKTLRARNISSLSTTQQANRIALLDKLNGYWHSRAFPVNDYTNYKTPVFIDRNGNHCAVGYLMQQSGAEELAQQINREQQFAYVHQIKVAGVQEWADKNGFTVDELAWIQPTYEPENVLTSVEGGTNGPVNVMYSDYTEGLIFAGNFDTIGSLPCVNMGRYKNNQLSCLGNGLHGVINAIDVINAPYNIIVAGAVSEQQEGVKYPLAIFKNSSWKFIEIPNRIGATATAIRCDEYGAPIQVAISHPSIPNMQEIWFQKDNDEWEKQVTVKGTIFDIKDYYDKEGRDNVFVGAFDSAVIHRKNSGDTLLLVKNILFQYLKSYDDIPCNWIGDKDIPISDTILTAYHIGDALYLGGTCSDLPNRSKVCLTRFQNSTFQPMIMWTTYLYNYFYSINNIQLYQSNSLLLSGNFTIIPGGFGNYGNNLAGYDLTYNFPYAIGNLDSTVSTAAMWQNEWYIGGAFTHNGYSNRREVRHLAKIGKSFTAIPDVAEGNLQIYPNPATDVIYLHTDNNHVLQTELYDITGRKIIDNKVMAATKDISVAGLPTGVYLLRVLTNDGWMATKVMKE